MDKYTELATRTENQDFDGIGQRLVDNKDAVVQALNKAIVAARELDAVVKKTCFYGKPPKYSPVPLFDSQSPEAENVLRSEVFIRLLHGFMGISTEAGEGLEALAQRLNGGPLDTVNVGEELGDVFWYSAIVAATCGTTFQAEQEKNIKKLAKRYGDKFDDVKSMERDLEAERAILEGKA